LKSARLKSGLLLLLGLCASVLIPFLYWHGVWFGRPLDEPQFQEYLKDKKQPRRIQHALTQIGERIQRKDSTIHAWYPMVSELSKHPLHEVRITVAWVMGQDPASQLFHKSLLVMLNDPAPLVRRNVALSLVRFGDTSGLSELRAMLQPYTLKATSSGKVSYRKSEGDWVKRGEILVVLIGEDRSIDLSTPVPGYIRTILLTEGSSAIQNQNLIILSTDPNHVWEALRALYLVGGDTDLRLITSIIENPEFGDQIHQQALLTSKAIQNRLSEKSE